MSRENKRFIAALMIIAMELSSFAGYTMPVYAQDVLALTDEAASVGDIIEGSDESIIGDITEDPDGSITGDVIDDITVEDTLLDPDDEDIFLTDDGRALTDDEASVIGTGEDDIALFTDEEASDAGYSSESDITGIKIEHGMAQPIIDFTDNFASAIPDYKNTYIKDGKEVYRDIIRFCVYVETDYDTDQDGKNDLVQALVQVPAAAAMGKYKAPTLFHASPYMAGNSSKYAKEIFEYNTDPGSFKEEDLYVKKPGRTPKGETVSSLEAAKGSQISEWYYEYENLQTYDDFKEKYFLNELDEHDYFLARGFAVVLAAGLGTNGSEGLETCGSIAERDAFKNVVEWINGKRVAYTDKENDRPIKAEWANGNVAMEGMSYDGTMAYEVATTGVDGLKTVIPEGAISSWYDYSNTQGVSNGYYGTDESAYDYTTYLSSLCSSRFFGKDTTVTDSLKTLYNQLLGYLRNKQKELKGHYGEYWVKRDYSKPAGMKASALIVHGLNDYNVKTKQADLMRKAFADNNCEVRMILHQGEHETPNNMDIRGYDYDEILNLWLCHYLLNEDNKITSTLPNVLVQSNVNGMFYDLDKWDGNYTISMNGYYKTVHIDPVVSVNKPGAESMIPQIGTKGSEDLKNAYFTLEDFRASLPTDADSADAAGSEAEGEQNKYEDYWALDVYEDITINGKCVADLQLATDDVSKDVLVAGVMLYDISNTDFPVYKLTDNDSMSRNTIKSEAIYKGDGLAYADLEEFSQSNDKMRLITKGVINLKNPEAGYGPETATERSTPIEKNKFYNYEIHMLPTVYTVKAGHTLGLYIMPEMDGIKSQSGFLINIENSTVTIPLVEQKNGSNDPNMPVAAAPTASRPSGAVEKGTRIMLNCATPGAEIYYTLDGSLPALSGNGEPATKATKKYEDAFVIDSDRNTVIKAMSAIDGYESSDVVTFEYWIAKDWKDIDKEKQKKLFGNDFSKVPQGMWYCFEGVDVCYTKAGNTGYARKYTGDKLTFNNDIRVYYGTSMLWENRDYTVSYKYNTNAATVSSSKAPSVIVKGKGNYTSSAVFKFTINRRELSDDNIRITSEKGVAVNVGSKLGAVKPVIAYGDRKLAYGKDYTLDYFKYVSGNYTPASPNDKCEAGAEYRIWMVAKEGGNYTGDSYEHVRVYPIDPKNTKLIRMKNVRVTLPKQKYTGEPLSINELFDNSGSRTAKATVKNGRDTLIYNKDFTVDDVSFTDAGKYRVSLHGKGNAVGDRIVTLEIVGTPASKVKIGGLKTSCEYVMGSLPLDALYKEDRTGYKKVTLYTVVNGKNKVLSENKDYTVEMGNTGATGKFKLIFSLKGEYSGTIKKTITVKPFNMSKNSWDMISVVCSPATFCKAGAVPEVKVMFDKITLEEGVDYRLSYKNNTKTLSANQKNSPTVVVRGIGNFTGTFKKTFTVNKADASNIVMFVPDKEYKANASKGYYKSTPKLMDGGKAVSNGKGKDVEKLTKDSYKYYYAATGREISANDIVSCNTVIEVRVKVICSPSSPYKCRKDNTQELRGYYRLIDKNMNIAKASVSLKNPESMIYSKGEPVIPLKASDLKVVLNKAPVPSSGYEIVSITNNRFLGTATVELRGKGSYGGTKKFTFKVRAKKI